MTIYHEQSLKNPVDVPMVPSPCGRNLRLSSRHFLLGDGSMAVQIVIHPASREGARLDFHDRGGRIPSSLLRDADQ